MQSGLPIYESDNSTGYKSSRRISSREFKKNKSEPTLEIKHVTEKHNDLTLERMKMKNNKAMISIF